QLHPVDGLVVAAGYAHPALTAPPGGDHDAGLAVGQVLKADGPGLAVLFAPAAAEALAGEGRQVHPVVEGGDGGGLELFEPLVQSVAERLDGVVVVVLE